MTREFRTASLHLSAWLIATKKLPYLRSEPRPNKPSQKVFVFDDRDSIAMALAHEFMNGDPPCGVKSYNGAIKILRDEVSTGVGDVSR